MRLPRVSEFMDTVVPTLAPDADILAAVDFLLAHHVTGAPVVDASGALVGMITETDCLRLLSTGHRADRPTGRVADFMTKNPITVPPHMDIYYAAGIFLSHSFRRLPVVQNGAVVGAITRYDILRAIQANFR